MKTTRILSLGIFSLLLAIVLVSSIDAISAQTLVAGKVYDSAYSQTILGASVVVACGSYSLSTLTLDDGTFAVRFEENDCKENDNVLVSSTKGNLVGSGSGVVAKCDGTNDCTEGLFSIVNLNIKPKIIISGSSSTGGSGSTSRGYYNCGNNKCDSGESINTCPRDCKATNQTNQTLSGLSTGNTGTNGADEESLTQNIDSTVINGSKTDSGNNLFGLSGAVLGTSNSIKLLFAVLFLVILVCLLIAVRIVNHN